MSKSIAIIDCAIKEPSLFCFNKLTASNLLCSFHSASQMGVISLKKPTCYKAIIIFGSYSHVHEELLWHQDLLKWTTHALDKGVPVLGICFGHQLLSRHFGATIKEVNIFPQTLEGSRKVTFHQNFNCFTKGDSYQLFVSHQYEVSNLPDQLISLASSEDCRHEVVAHQSLPFLGVQAHPEGSERFPISTLTKPISARFLNKVKKMEWDLFKIS